MSQWIVTGGASGIGAQIVSDLLKDNNAVTIWDVQAPIADIDAVYYQVDLLKPGAVEAAVAKIGVPIRGFIHCAGITAPTSIGQSNAASQLRAAFEVHVVAFVVAVQGLADRLHEGRGSIVAIASAAMDVLYPGSLAYGSTKAALRRVIDQLAVEFGPRGIRVNGIAPGAISTPMTNKSWSDEAYANERRAYIPLSRQGGPEAVSDLALFLASDKADYITGETIYVDGGVRHGIFNAAVRQFNANS